MTTMSALTEQGWLYVERTGNIFSIAGTEYIIKFPNGDITNVWSPLWNDYCDADEDLGALLWALCAWEDKSYTAIPISEVKEVFHYGAYADTVEVIDRYFPELKNDHSAIS